MEIKHVFQNVNPVNENPFDWDLRFYTEDTILKRNDDVSPTTLVIGTFNPALPLNQADFFYGRNYFWSALDNIFNRDPENFLTSKRITKAEVNVPIETVFDICNERLLCFTDLISSIFSDNDDVEVIGQNGTDKLIHEGITYNPYEDDELCRINARRKVNWNTQHIIDFLNTNPQIQQVFFTRQKNGCWLSQLDQITENCQVQIVPIYTPSAQSPRLHQDTGIRKKMGALMRHWTSYHGPDYGNMNNNEWLTENGVNLDNF